MRVGEPRHSLLLFVSDVVEEQLVQEVGDWVRRGVKVWLFAMDSLETCGENEAWQPLRKAGLLQWWQVPFQASFEGKRVGFIDGQVTDWDLYRYLCDETNFNREQYEVEHSSPEGHLLVTAGAGTGKTTTLIDRLLFLCHCDPKFSFDSTAMITFTNAAALEMRTRLGKRLLTYFEVTRNPRYLQWLDGIRDLFLSTIHSFAKTLLERTGTLQGYSSGLRLRSYQELKNRLIEAYIDKFADQHQDIFHTFSWIPQYQLVRSLRRIHEAVENRSLSTEELKGLDLGEDESGYPALVSFVLTGLSQELEQIKEESGEWELSDLIRQLVLLQETEGGRSSVGPFVTYLSMNFKIQMGFK